MKKLIIIGAGVSGLSAGILARNSGFETEIYEMHAIAGGLCTSWKRKGYVYDGCIRYMYGSGREGQLCHSIMQKIGADALSYIHLDESIRIETVSGKTVIFFCDLDRLEKHCLEISPEDAVTVKDFVKAAKVLGSASMPEIAEKSSDTWKRMKAGITFLPVMLKYQKTTLGSFATGLKSPVLREAFLKYYGYTSLENLPLINLLFDLAQLHVQNAGWPIGGSLAFARALESRYLSLGGKIRYSAKVEKILVEEDRAVGIRLENGQEYRADYILSAGDIHTALETLLDGKYTSPVWQKAFEKDTIIKPIIQVSLGIDADLSHISPYIVFSPQKPVQAAGIRYDSLAFRHYCFDPSMAPRGKSVATVLLETEYEVWENLQTNREGYSKEKSSVAEQVIRQLELRFPEIAGRVENIDVATPMTYVRYTGNYRGSPQGWQYYLGQSGLYPEKLPGLKNFMLIGQWVRRGGGLPNGALSAYQAVKKLCAQYRVKMK